METTGIAVRMVEILREYGKSGLPFKLLARKLQRRESEVAQDFEQLSEKGVVEQIGDVVRLRWPAHQESLAKAS